MDVLNSGLIKNDFSLPAVIISFEKYMCCECEVFCHGIFRLV